jgi:hypothetical protein
MLGHGNADNISVNSIEGMKNALPGLRRKLNTDPVYFKKVYMHTFDLAKAAGARTLAFDTGESDLLSPLTSMFLAFEDHSVRRRTRLTSSTRPMEPLHPPSTRKSTISSITYTTL